MGQSEVERDCLIGIDVGTQSVRALLVNRSARLRIVASRPTPTLRPRPGLAEYHPDALWQTTIAVLCELAAQVPKGHAVAGMAVASMGESCVLLDARGAALGNVLAWFDPRTEQDAEWLAKRVTPDRLFAITGLARGPTYTLCKLLRARRTEPGRFAEAKRVLNIADWIAFRLSGEAATDYSLASRTSCLDLRHRRWSHELLAELDIDPAIFPSVRASGTTLGPVRAEVLAETGLCGSPVVGVGGHDHVCGAFAADALAEGTVLDSMGTAELILTAVTEPAMTPESVRRGYAQGAMQCDLPLFYLGGTINSSGGAVEWVRGLSGEVVTRDTLFTEAAKAPPGSNGVCFLPHLAYAGPPNDDVAARAAFLGLSAGKGRREMFRAVLEGLAMEARGVIQGMTDFAVVPPSDRIVVIGGSTRNRLFLEIKASVYGRPITVNAEPEATALGAALMAGLAAGLWPDVATALATMDRKQFTVDPNPDWMPVYDALFSEVHARLYPAIKPIQTALVRYEEDQIRVAALSAG